MAVIQPVFYVPPHLEAGLASGLYKRFGSVVRDHRQIIAHLDEIEIPKKEAAVARIAKALQGRNGAIVLGLGVVVVGSIAFWAAGKQDKGLEAAADPEIPECVETYNSALGVYLEAVRHGRLDADTIDRLLSSLDELMDQAGTGTITLGFSPEQSETLVKLVVDYTRQLAEVNSVALDEAQAESDGSPIAELRRYLTVQKQIFDSAA